MYAEFYKLSAMPFQLTPDPRFFFGSAGHTRAMAHLTYGLHQGEGFIIITGDVGAGKTTLVDLLLSKLDKTSHVAAKIVTTQLAPDDTLRMAAVAFGVYQEGLDKAALLRRIESFVTANLRAGKRSLLIVDEAQNLSVGSLEELRMLTNFSVGGSAPLQSFLLGQPQFRSVLENPALEQLRQRVTASYHLGPMTELETQAYILHRLKTVGWKDDPLFADGFFTAVYNHTGGVPRRINTLCSRILLFGFLEQQHAISSDIVDQVAEELNTELGRVTERRDRPVEQAHTAEEPALADLSSRIAVLERSVTRHDRAIRRAIEIAANYVPAKR
jgi:putative secretion ATPase (PEP-CTERM system associated)